MSSRKFECAPWGSSSLVRGKSGPAVGVGVYALYFNKRGCSSGTFIVHGTRYWMGKRKVVGGSEVCFEGGINGGRVN